MILEIKYVSPYSGSQIEETETVDNVKDVTETSGIITFQNEKQEIVFLINKDRFISAKPIV